MTFRKKYIAAMVVLLVLFFIYRHYHQQANPVQTPSVFVNSQIVKESSVPLSVQAIGTITAKSVDITPELAGHVTAVLVRDGTAVKKGEPIIQLDDAVYKAKLTSAKAQLLYSENNYKRMIQLGKQGAIAKQAIDQAEADVKTRRADVLEDEVMVSKMKLIAPFDGVLGKVKINPGDYLTIGQSLATVTDINHLHVEYALPESYYPFIKTDQVVEVRATAFPTQRFTGKVAFISPVVSKESRSVQLYAEVDNHSNQLAPGMLVNITQLMGRRDHALLIPARSLITVLDGQQVYKIVAGKAYAVRVNVGIRTGNDIEITTGIKPGDMVVTDGQIKLRDGMMVRT